MKTFLCLFLLVATVTTRAEDVINYAPHQISAAEQRARDKAAEIAKAIQERRVVVGMSAAECVAAWGAPTIINKTTTSSGQSEQWVYRSTGRYLYLDNGILSTVQE